MPLCASRHSHIGTSPKAWQTTTPANKPIPKPNTPPRPPMCQPALTHKSQTHTPTHSNHRKQATHPTPLIDTSPKARQTTTPANKPISKPNTPPRPPMRKPPLTHKTADTHHRPQCASQHSHIKAKPARRRTATTENKPLIRHPSQQHAPMCQPPLTHRHKPHSPANQAYRKKRGANDAVEPLRE